MNRNVAHYPLHHTSIMAGPRKRLSAIMIAKTSVNLHFTNLMSNAAETGKIHYIIKPYQYSCGYFEACEEPGITLIWTCF